MDSYDYSELKNGLFKDAKDIEQRDKLCQRLLYFSHNFQKQFTKKLCNYEEEATGKSVKLHKRTQVVQFLFSGLIGAAGAGFIGLSAYKAGQKIGKHISKGVECIDTHQNKAVNVTIKLEDLCKNEDNLKLFIRVAVKIFSIYEEQLMSIFDNENWLLNKEGLIKDAVKKIIEHIESLNENEKDDSFENIIIKPFINVISKNNSLLSVVVKRSKSVVKKGNYWSFSRLDKKSGIIVRKNKNQEMEYYWTGEGHPKFGFKLLPSDLINDEMKILSSQVEKPINNYSHLLEFSCIEKLDEIVDTIRKIMRKHVTGNSIDMHSNIIEVNHKVDKLLNVNINEREKGNTENTAFEFVNLQIIPPIINFTGRQKELKEIDEKLKSNQSKGCISQAVCICGMGGMGKTELARKYIKEHAKKYEHKYWINAENPKNISTKTFYEKIKLKTSKCLIVFDNAHTFDDVQPFFPKEHLENCYFLITSRSRIWDAGLSGKVEIVDLSDFNEAFEFIKNNFPQEEESKIKLLIEALHNLPLALQQAVSFIKNKQKRLKMFLNNTEKKNYTILDYVKEFKANSKMVLDKHFAVNKTDQQRYLETVYSTWNVTFEQIKNNEEYGYKAINIMRIISYLPSSFNIKILTINEMNEDAILLLNKYSIINMHKEQINIHRLVQEVIRLQLQKEPAKEIDVLKRVIFLKNIFHKCDFSIETVCEHLCKYPKEVIGEYCKKTPIANIPFFYIINFSGEKFFDKMMEVCEWNDKTFRIIFVENNMYNFFNILRCGSKHIIKIIHEKLNLSPNELRRLAYEAAKLDRVDLLDYLKEYIEEIDYHLLKLISLLFCTTRNKQSLEYLNYLNQEKCILDSIIKLNYEQYDYDKYWDILKIGIKANYQGVVKILLEHGAKQDGVKHLIDAIKLKREYAFKELADNEVLQFINYKDDKERNLLDLACIKGTLSMVNYLENVGFKNTLTLTFNFDYYFYCQIEVFDYFLNKDDIFDINEKDASGRTALFYAVRTKRICLVKSLLKKGQSLNITDIYGNSLLHYAVSDCDMDINNRQLLLHPKYSFELSESSTDLLEFLINSGIDSLKCNLNKQTAVFIAAYYHQCKAIQILVKAFNNQFAVNDCDSDKRTMLHYATMHRQYKYITELIRGNEQLKSTQKNELALNKEFTHSNFHFDLHKNRICVTNLIKTVQLLLELGANPYKLHDNLSCTPLHYICIFSTKLSDDESQHFDMSATDAIGNTPLHYAANTKNVQLLEWLIENEYFMNIVNNRNQNLLHYLATTNQPHYFDKRKYINVVKLLINEKDLDVNLKDNNGYSPLEYARLNNKQFFLQAIEEINSSIK